MKKLPDTEYDPNLDGEAYFSGIFKGNVLDVDTKKLNSGSYLIVLTAKVSKENKELPLSKMKYDPETEKVILDTEADKVSGESIIGRTYQSNGIFVTPSPAPGEGWRNRRYVNIFESLGVKFAKMDNGKTKLALVESKDVIGLPGMFNLTVETYNRKDGTVGKSTRITDVMTWADAKRLSEEDMEDVPF